MRLENANNTLFLFTILLLFLPRRFIFSAEFTFQASNVVVFRLRKKAAFIIAHGPILPHVSDSARAFTICGHKSIYPGHAELGEVGSYGLARGIHGVESTDKPGESESKEIQSSINSDRQARLLSCILCAGLSGGEAYFESCFSKA